MAYITLNPDPYQAIQLGQAASASASSEWNPHHLERKISFRMLHQKCKTPISYKLFYEEGLIALPLICSAGYEVPNSEIAYGYKVERA